MHALLGHIADRGRTLDAWLWVAVGVAGIALALWALDHHTRNLGLPRRSRQSGGVSSRLVSLVVVVALSAVLMPSSGAGQQVGGALPDLISDPPRPAFLTEQADPSGAGRLLLTFDGYVHNIGDGALDVTGNPQVPNGMVQNVLDGDTWREVSTPTIRYETDDGHNHFHLIEVIEYVLWEQTQGSQTAVGSKIGFCLVDSEQIEPGVEAAYSEEKDNFCEEDNPGATSLRMGISPGWRDVYDAATTLQWVDISELAPGRYWIGAITDPNDEIVESNEENNSLVFSDRPAIVPGWLPSDSEATTDGSPLVVDFAVEAFGTVTDPTFVIEQGPASGRIDVPPGAAAGRSITYFPDPGFTGSDEIVFSVRDTNSQFPTTLPTATVTIEVTSTSPDDAGAAGTITAPTLLAESTFFEVTTGEAFSTPLQAQNADGTAAQLFAVDLPPGVHLETETSRLTGIPVRPGIFESELVAIADPSSPESPATRQPITFIVSAGTNLGLTAHETMSSPLQRELQQRVGRPGLGYRYEADGLPPGLTIDETSPIVRGTPTEVGVFEVELRHFEPTAPDDVAHTERFTWVIRPAVAISFAL